LSLVPKKTSVDWGAEMKTGVVLDVSRVWCVKIDGCGRGQGRVEQHLTLVKQPRPGWYYNHIWNNSWFTFMCITICQKLSMISSHLSHLKKILVIFNVHHKPQKCSYVIIAFITFKKLIVHFLTKISYVIIALSH
jgi:hypothetical protein